MEIFGSHPRWRAQGQCSAPSRGRVENVVVQQEEAIAVVHDSSAVGQEAELAADGGAGRWPCQELPGFYAVDIILMKLPPTRCRRRCGSRSRRASTTSRHALCTHLDAAKHSTLGWAPAKSLASGIKFH
jgi:hypothetical protein